jgi:hypothetical protein
VFHHFARPFPSPPDERGGIDVSDAGNNDYLSGGVPDTCRKARDEVKMGCGRMKVSCEDGFEVVTKDKNELVALTQWHTDHAHHKKVSEQEVMAMQKHP